MARGQSIKPVRPDSLSKQVCDTLREAIFAGQFQPGEALRELHLAKLFAVSQATIREALVQLEQSGLVVREKNRKTTVASFTAAELRDRLVVRVELEALAFVRAADNMKEGDFKKLNSVAQSLQRSIDRGNWKEVTMNDLRFHHFVWSRSANPVLERMLDQLTTPLFAFFGRIHEKASTNPASGLPHEALIEALRSRDEETVREAVRVHVEKSYGALLTATSETAAARSAQADSAEA